MRKAGSIHKLHVDNYLKCPYYNRYNFWVELQNFQKTQLKNIGKMYSNTQLCDDVKFFIKLKKTNFCIDYISTIYTG